MNPDLSNPKKFVGTSYPRKSLNPTKLLVQTLSVNNLKELAPSYGSRIYCHQFQLSKSVKKSQNKIGRIAVVLHVSTIAVCGKHHSLKDKESGYFYESGNFCSGVNGV